MNKKEKLDYFRLVEPKLREKMLSNELQDSDFEKLNIKGADIDLFKKIYQDFWVEMLVDESLFKDESLKDFIDDDPIIVLDFPEDKYFYQFGVGNIDIKSFKFHLESRDRLLFINKKTGGIELQNSVELVDFPNEKDFHNRINIVVDNPFTFLEQLKNGEIDKILANQKKNPSEWEIPPTHSMYGVIDYINIDDFIDVLGFENPWITYDINFENFLSYQDFDTLKMNIEFISESGYDQRGSKFFFKIEHPLKLRLELINGNMEVLNDIKINFCDIFLHNNDEA